MNTDADATRQQRLTRDEFAALFRRLKSTADWGAADRRGALNHITPAHVIAAARKSGSGGACHSPGRSRPNRPRTTPNPRTTT